MFKNVITKKLHFSHPIMKNFLAAAIVIISFNTAIAQTNEDDFEAIKQNYNEQRDKLISIDDNFLFDSDISLNSEESKLNDFLVSLRKEMTKEFRKSGNIPANRYFFYNKSYIEHSRLFSILKKMPKGGILHIHTNATGSADWFIKKVFTVPHTYIYWGKDNDKYLKGQMGVYKPNKVPPGFVSAKELRKKIPHFEQELYKLITLGPEDYKGQDIWVEFEKVFHRIDNFVSFKPVFMDYYKETFEAMAEENIQYVELRSSLGKTVDINEKYVRGKDAVHLFHQIRENVRKKYPEFDYKLIVCSNRAQSKEQIKDKIQLAKELQKIYPDFIVGYDLIGEEDPNNSNYYYIDELLKAKDINYYLHSGESNWQQDKNLYDAYLLNAKRIGHGINLFFFPNLKKDIIDKKIAIEVCPISNQLLGYINDLRIHPARQYLLSGLPCVISSDDPLIFQTHGLSYDFWSVFMAWNLDLKALKKLTMNSIIYSGMSDTEKEKALTIWQKRWDEFIKSSIDELNL